MTRIKICGLSRPCDIEFVNEAKPDYCGFVINEPKSRRNVSPAQVRSLVSRLNPVITPVGVFVDQPAAFVADLVREGTIAVIQLHGHEDETYLSALRKLTNAPVMQAFRVADQADLDRAAQSSADYVLLDNGAGGTGEPFDWSLLQNFNRPFFLAGGLGPQNLERAVRETRPFAVDMSSGVETNGVKDQAKIQAAVQIVRDCDDT